MSPTSIASGGSGNHSTDCGASRHCSQCVTRPDSKPPSAVRVNRGSSASVACGSSFSHSRNAGFRGRASSDPWSSAELQGSLLALPLNPAFREWEKLLPQATDAEEPRFTLTADGGLESGRVTHWLQWREAPQSVEWFPDPPEAIEVGDIRVQTRGGLTRIDATVRRRLGAEGPADELPSLVVVTGADGVRTGWRMNVNLKNQPS